MTQVFFKHNGPERELPFVKWTDKSLIVKYPAESISAGENWRMALSTVEFYIWSGCMRIVGEMPSSVAAQQARAADAQPGEISFYGSKAGG